jgi:exopolysaccharide biosynthesis polyprenyl glycosylphosphotransferase
MRRRHPFLYTSLFCLFNAVAVWLIWWCAIYVRIRLDLPLANSVAESATTRWVPSLWSILAFWLPASLWHDAGRMYSKTAIWTSALCALEDSAILTTITAVITFFSRQSGELKSRMFVPVLFAVSLPGFALLRFALISGYASARKHWLPPFRVAVVGDWCKAGRVVEQIRSASLDALQGVIVPEGALATVGALHAAPILGTTRQLQEVVNREQLDKIVIVDAAVPEPELAYCTEIARNMDLDISCALDFVSEPFRVNLDGAYGLEFVHCEPVHLTRGQQIVKRVLDVAMSALFLLMLAPLLLCVAFLVKVTSKGPILYKSRRVGKGGRHFSFLKFRSMYSDSDRSKVAAKNEKDGHIFKIRNDPRITPIGHFIRRYSIDELPQLINVLRGEMSLVGPRPLPASDLSPDGMSEQFSAWAEGRAEAWPGLTGLWQISGRSDLPFEEMVRLDLSYIQNWSVWLDLTILRDTPLAVLRGIGAY